METTPREFSYSLTFRTHRLSRLQPLLSLWQVPPILYIPPKDTALQPQRSQETTFVSFPSVAGRQSLAAIRESFGFFMPTETPTINPPIWPGCGTFVHNQDVLGIL